MAPFTFFTIGYGGWPPAKRAGQLVSTLKAASAQSADRQLADRRAGAITPEAYALLTYNADFVVNGQ